MQGTRIAVWVLVVSLGATALMFGASSLIRAGGGDGSNVVVEDVGAQQVTDTGTEYRRQCRRSQWDDLADLRFEMWMGNARARQTDRRETTYRGANAATLRRELDNANARILTLSEELAVFRVLSGVTWRDIVRDWPDRWTPPTRRELAETTEWCVGELTSEAERWIAAAR